MELKRNASRGWRKILAAAVLVLFMPVATAGCFGNFNMTRKLYNWHDTVSSDKWSQWLIFFFTSFAYMFTTMFDSLFANSVEFWTGTNPVTVDAGTVRTATGPDGEMLRTTFNEDRTILVEQFAADGSLERALVLRQGDNALVAENLQGEVVAQVFDEGGQPRLVKYADF